MNKLTNLSTLALVFVLIATLVLAGCSQQTVTSSQPASTTTTSTSPAATTPANTQPSQTTPSPVTTTQLTPVEVPIGMTLFITGPYASLGINLQRIAEMTIEDINKNGFVVGDKLVRFKPIIDDSSMDAAKAATIIRKHVYEDKVKFEYAVSSNIISVIQEVTEPSGVLLMAGAVVNSAFGPDKPLTFSHNSTFYESIAGLMSYVQNTYPDMKRVWIESSDQEATRQGVESAYKPTVEYLGYDLIGSEYYPLTTTDFYGIIDRILAAKPDIIIGAVTGPSVAFDKQLRERGFTGLIISPSGNPAANFVTAIGGNEAANNVIVTGVNERADVLPAQVKDFVSRFQQRYNEYPNGSLLYILDQFYALSEAMTQAGTYEDTQKIAQVMATSEFQGPFGKIKYGGAAIYGSNCIASPPVFVNAWEDGNFVTKEIIDAVDAQQLIAKVLESAKK